MSEIFLGNNDRYISEKILGRGGMSEVFLVRSATKGRLFAAKRARRFEDNTRQKAALFQIKNETVVLKYLSGNKTRGVPKLIDRGEDFFVMEFIEGKTLSPHAMKFDEAVDILLKLSDIFISFEDMEPGVVYLDLKPTNIMFGKKGEVYLIDFGCAKFIKRYEEISTKDEGKANGKNNFRAGTKSYAAPEQFGEGISEDTRTDIFQFGQLINEISKKGKIGKYERKVFRDIALKCTRVKQSNRPMTFRDIRKELMKSKKKSRLLLAKSFLKIATLVLSGSLMLLFAYLAVAELRTVKAGDLAGLCNTFSEFFKGIKLSRAGEADINIITRRFYGNLMSEAKKILYNNNRGLVFAALCILLKKVTGYFWRIFGRSLFSDEKDNAIPENGPYFIDIVKTCDSIE